jgi:hypothetical protein
MATLMPRCRPDKQSLLRFAGAYFLFAICAFAPSGLRAQTATEDRLLFRGWWPRHSTPAADEYVGPAPCARCHPDKAATQKNTPMGRTADLVANSDILSSGSRLTFQAGNISYEIVAAEGHATYKVADGARSNSAPLSWSFGDGHIGQSWLFERDGEFYESRVSYFDTLKALDFTPGRKLTEPQDLEQAMARPVNGAELVVLLAMPQPRRSAKSLTGVESSPELPAKRVTGQVSLTSSRMRWPTYKGKRGKQDRSRT